MKKLLLAFTLGIFGICTNAQNGIDITAFPKDKQLLPRNVATNKGYYTISGKIQQNTGISALHLKIFKAESLVKESSLPLNFNQNSASFSIPMEINAELMDYKIELHGVKNTDLTLLRKAERVVAGDVIIVNGQSNNLGTPPETDEHPFMRSFSDQFGWNEIKYIQPSRWAPRIAKNIIENHKIPVAIFNESYGGVRLDYFLKKADPLAGNYGEMLKKLEKAEVKSNVRAIIWWQGESDGWEVSIDEYKNMYKKLQADWFKDFKNVKCYLFQIRFRSCTHVKPYIMEAQRQLAAEIDGLNVMSTNAARSDGCHFYYTGGYDSLGNRMYRLIASEIYGASTVNAQVPDVEKAWFSAENEITIQLKNVVGNLKTIGNPWPDFRLEGLDAAVTDRLSQNIQGSVSGSQIILRFVGDSSSVKGISYLSHIENRDDWIVNLLGTGILSFYNVPISAKPPAPKPNTEGVAIFDISPTVTGNSILLKWSTAKSNKKTVAIYNAVGVQVFAKEVDKDEKNLRVDISNFISGHYFVVLNEEGKRASVRKIVKI